MRNFRFFHLICRNFFNLMIDKFIIKSKKLREISFYYRISFFLSFPLVSLLETVFFIIPSSALFNLLRRVWRMHIFYATTTAFGEIVVSLWGHVFTVDGTFPESLPGIVPRNPRIFTGIGMTKEKVVGAG